MYRLEYKQKLPISLQESWNFFSQPDNLKTITPEHLSFDITQGNKEKMYAGQIIVHVIRPIWNFPLEWITEITHVQEPHYFIDEQRLGPYKFWHHEHRFNSIPNGVEMIDLVYYKLPYGPLGKIFHYIKVQNDLETIFSYRRSKLEEKFGSYPEEIEHGN